jgi:hypothetical protein
VLDVRGAILAADPRFYDRSEDDLAELQEAM